MQFDLQVIPESKQGENLQVALLLIKQYEDEKYAIPIS
jgi:HTH-type transcriptional regulator/antitoxin HigA